MQHLVGCSASELLYVQAAYGQQNSEARVYNVLVLRSSGPALEPDLGDTQPFTTTIPVGERRRITLADNTGLGRSGSLYRTGASGDCMDVCS